MDVDASPGPEREAVVLPKWEADAFLMLVEANTYAEARYQLSFALKQLRFEPSKAVIDGFQRNARKMWRPNPSADSSP